MSKECNEFSLVTITGEMHHYLDSRWTVLGPSRVGIYHDSVANSFRIVGRTIDYYQVVANCAISDTFCYNQSTVLFHQWRDHTSKVYGVKFVSTDDAQIFAQIVQNILNTFEKINRLLQSSDTDLVNPETNPDKNNNNNNSSPIMVNNSKSNSMSNLVVETGIVNENTRSDVVNSSHQPSTNHTKHQKPAVMAKPESLKPKLPEKLQSLSLASNSLGREPKSSSFKSTNFISEIEQRLARRRAKIESLEENGTHNDNKDNQISESTNEIKFPINSAMISASNGINSAASDTNKLSLHSKLESNWNRVNIGIHPDQTNDATQIERLKAEILEELRQELSQFKQDLIASLKSELLPHLR